MKKILLCGLVASLWLRSDAQQSSEIQIEIPSSIMNQTSPYHKITFTGNEVTKVNVNGSLIKNGSKSKSKLGQSGTTVAAITEVKIGETTYDLQTNSSIMRRVHNLGGGKFSSVWTFGSSFNGLWKERGTGYVFNNGTTWEKIPTERLESVKTGWPDLAYTSDGREFIIAHDPENKNLVQTSRAATGLGGWKEKILTNLNPMAIWPRLAIGGANGETLHLIALTTPKSTGGTLYKDMDGALLYSRSTDGGSTWDTPIQLPDMNINFFPGSIGGDSYAIDAKGNVVTVAVAEFGQNVYVWKSVDNGITWVKHIAMDNEVGPFTFDDPAISDTDTFPTSGGCITVIIDNNDMVHTVFDKVRILDANKIDGLVSIFLGGFSSLGYWNETMPDAKPKSIGIPLNTDKVGNLSISQFNIPRYRNSNTLISHPHLGMDDKSGLYLIYSAITEYTNFEDYYRHVFGIYSKDNGCSWSVPSDLTPGPYDQGPHEEEECMFASIAKNVDDNLYFTYQSDYLGGTSLDVPAGETPSEVYNDSIIFAKVPVADLPTQPGWCFSYLKGDSIFCLGDSVYVEASCGTDYAWSNGANSSGVWLKSHGTFTVTITSPCGPLQQRITTKAPSSAPTLSVKSSSLETCNGDSVTLSASSSFNSTFKWSTGATTSEVKVDSVGVYYVTATNCGGAVKDSVKIKLPGVPQATVTSTTNFTACTNDSTMITAGLAPSAAYKWSNGDSTQSIYALNGGTYSVTVSNCGGFKVKTVSIATTPLPTATVTTNGQSTTICEGTSVTFIATGGDSYKWSTGATNPFITVSQAGDYIVQSYNACNDTAFSPIQKVVVNPKPATPTVTVTIDNSTGLLTFTSSASSGNQWYSDNIAISGKTGTIYEVDWKEVEGKKITVDTKDSKQCVSDKSIPLLAIKTGIEDISLNTFALYPNPSNGVFEIRFGSVSNENFVVSVQNLVGQVIYNSNLNISSKQIAKIDLSTLDKGVYFLNISNGKTQNTQKIIIK